MKKPDIQRLIEFHKLLTSFAEIERIVHLKRRGDVMLESDTEHAYNLAMMAWFVSEHFPELKQEKVIKLALVHDLVEIHAGDTFVFADQAMIDSKKEREAKAQQQLKQNWQDFPGLHEAIEEYESLSSPEACYVYAFDKLMPMITVFINDGITWREKEMTLEKMERNKSPKIKVAPDVCKYWRELHRILVSHPELFPQPA